MEEIALAVSAVISRILQIMKTLQSCATEGFYYVADDHKQIEETMSLMVREVLQENWPFPGEQQEMKLAQNYKMVSGKV